MLGNFGANDAVDDGTDGAVDARSAALQLMSEALAHLDSDAKIPALIGAHLQSAIDSLWASTTGGQHSGNLH